MTRQKLQRIAIPGRMRLPGIRDGGKQACRCGRADCSRRQLGKGNDEGKTGGEAPGLSEQGGQLRIGQKLPKCGHELQASFSHLQIGRH